MNNEPTALDLAKARRALESANAPAFSLADAIQDARERFERGELGPSRLMAPATRPRDVKGQMAWDALQAAKARVIAYDAQPQTAAKRPEPTPEAMTDDELKARIAALRAQRGTK